MSNYDIGIYTFWNVPNYGTFAQAYALQKAVQKAFPDRDVKQIAYLDSAHYDSYYSRWPKCHVWNKKFFKELTVRNSKQAKEKCALFLENYKLIPHTEEFSKENLEKARFNTVILGSDIIWDYSFECFNHDEFLFGLNFTADNIVSYAASFGTIRKTDSHPDYVISGIRKMKHITVREQNSADIVKDITGRTVPIVLDPTWLWDFNADPMIEKSPYDNYVVVYGQDFTNKFIEEVTSFCKKNKYKIICLDCNNDNYTWCDVLIKQNELSPFQWLGIFKGAEAVATSTFHGVTFALIFQKKLAFCKSDFILAKAGDFLKKVGLYELYTKENASATEMLERVWDYEQINCAVNKMREKSATELYKIIE